MQSGEGLGVSFVVFDEPAEFDGPCEGSFDHPAAWQEDEAALGFGQLDASPVQFECQVTQIIQRKGKADEALEQWLVLGEAIGIHIDHKLIEYGIYRTSSARPIIRGGRRADYFEVTEDRLFHMFRPAEVCALSNFQRLSHPTLPGTDRQRTCRAAVP